MTRARALGPLAFAASVASTAFAAAAPTPPPAPAAPCGFVTFLPVAAPRITAGTWMERIRATVSFQDGHTETGTFPYPWVYPNGEQTDPWSATNLRRPNYAITIQFPPPGTDVRTLPPMIAYVVAHSDASGFTKLADCVARGSLAPLGGKSVFVEAPTLLRFDDESAVVSPVKILEATLSPVGADGHRLPGLVQQCVTFENSSARVVSGVRITFTYRDDRKRSATYTLSRTGALAPRAVVQGVRRDPGSLADAISDTSNCRVFGWPGDLTVLKVSVSSVTFFDGSTWTPRLNGAAPAPR